MPVVAVVHLEPDLPEPQAAIPCSDRHPLDRCLSWLEAAAAERLEPPTLLMLVAEAEDLLARGPPEPELQLSQVAALDHPPPPPLAGRVAKDPQLVEATRSMEVEAGAVPARPRDQTLAAARCMAPEEEHLAEEWLRAPV